MKYFKIVLIFFFVLFSISCFGQQPINKANVVVGVSVPELYHVGFRYHYIQNARLDFMLGNNFARNDEDKLCSFTVNHAYYFGKVNPKVFEKTWSFNSGFTLLHQTQVNEKTSVLYLNLYLAKEFMLTKRLFLQPELGASFFLFDAVKSDNNSSDVDFVHLLPKIGIILGIKI